MNPEKFICTMCGNEENKVANMMTLADKNVCSNCYDKVSDK